MRVQDVMTPDVRTIGADQSAETAFTTMKALWSAPIVLTSGVITS